MEASSACVPIPPVRCGSRVKSQHQTTPRYHPESVALLTEDRRATTGILGVLSVADNISIASARIALRKEPHRAAGQPERSLDLVATNKRKIAIKVPSPKTRSRAFPAATSQKVLRSPAG